MQPFTHFLPLAFVAAITTACTSQVHLAPQATTPQPTPPPSPPPVAASIPPANPDLPHQHDFLTSLPVRDAAETVLTALVQKLSLDFSNSSDNVEANLGSPNAALHAYPRNADYFSAISELSTSSGNKVRIDCEWIADGKTRVTLQSDLPADRFAVVEKVTAQSLDQTAVKAPG